MSVELAQGELATSTTDIIDECRERFTFCQDAEGSNRSEYEFDKRFVNGDQWDPTIRDERFSDRRPCLTVNITDAICRRVVNNCRENRPRICVHPVGNGASIQTAKVFDGLIRHIEYSSNAQYCYDTAVENAVHGGWGYIGVDAEYLNDKSFDQELRLVGWANPLICYADPNSRQPDGSDYDFFLETVFMKRAQYRVQYGHLDNEGWRWAGKGDDVPDWSNKEELRVCKYWRIERVKDELCLLDNGQLGWRSEVPRGTKPVDGPKRTVYRKKVRAYLLTAFKQLGTTLEWPGKWIPRVPIYGRRLDLNGRIQIKGMVRDLRDPARIYNYAKTKETELYALMPMAQWLGAAGFMEGKEAAWRDTNRKPIVALEYNPIKAENGELMPPPQRLDPPAVNAGFAEWGESSSRDFLHVAGMPHEPDLDKRNEVVSGLALKRRQGISDVSNFDFYDNLTRSLRHLGKIIVDLVPHYYDTPRVIRIIQEDGTPQTVSLNQPQLDPMTQAVLKIENDMTVGDYEVVVDTGPSYQTKREESAEALLELLGTPLGEMVAQAAGDKIVRQFDFADAEGVADRLSALIPAAQMEGLKDLPPKAQALIAGLQGQLKQLQRANMAMELELHDKRGIEQMKQTGETQRVHMKETGATERELLKLHGKADDTHVKALTAHNVAEIGAAAQIITKGMEHKHEAAMGERELAHEERMSDREMGVDLYEGERGRQHEASESHKDRQHEATEADKGREHEAKEAKAGRAHESQEASRERNHSSKEAQHQRGHEARQNSADRNRK